MAEQENTTEKEYNIPKKEAMHLTGVSEKTLQRWASDGLITVQYKQGTYGKHAYYNRDELLKMRHGKPRQNSDDAPMKQADLAAVVRGSEWSQQQLSQALSNISEQLPVIQSQLQELVKAKDETIQAKEEQGKLREEIGGLKESKQSLEKQQEDLQSKVGRLEANYKRAAPYKQYFRSAILWAAVLLLVVFSLSVAFAPQLESLRNLISSALG